MLTLKSFEFNPIQENTYLLYNEFNDCIIIDPGCYYDTEKEELVSFINDNKLKPVLLVNTHCHLDHVFGNKFLAEKYNLKLHTHSKEKETLAMAAASGLMFQLPFDNYTGEIIPLENEEFIKLGDDKLKILHTPGHSIASLSFYNEEGKFVISGDALFKGSIGRTDLPGGNMDLLLKSIRTQLFTLPAATIVYSGHGPTTTIGEEIKFNPFLN